VTALGRAGLIGALDLRRRLRDRSIVLQVFVAPIVLALIVGAAFSGSGGNLDATILIADADGTPVTADIRQALSTAEDDGGGVTFTAEVVRDPEEAATSVAEDRASAAVVLPAGFTEAVAAGEPAELIVVGSASSPIVTGVAQSVADQISAAVRSRALGSATAAQTADQLGVDLDQAALSEALAQPPPLRITDSRVAGTFNIMSYFAPGMAMIFLFFVMGTTARSVLTERRDGTLARILSGPTSATAVVLGKTLSVLVLGLLSMFTVYLVTTFGFGVDWGDPLGVLLVIVAVVIAIAGISLVIAGLARSEEQAQSLTIIGTLLLAILGGAFVFTSSGLLAGARAFTPNGQAIMAFIDLSAGEATWVAVLPRVLVILAIGLVTGSIGLLAIRRGLS
jgi:ABC-2 type transport system permease protein